MACSIGAWFALLLRECPTWRYGWIRHSWSSMSAMLIAWLRASGVFEQFSSSFSSRSLGCQSIMKNSSALSSACAASASWKTVACRLESFHSISRSWAGPDWSKLVMRFLSFKATLLRSYHPFSHYSADYLPWSSSSPASSPVSMSNYLRFSRNWTHDCQFSWPL